ncbi:ABC transporter ATP-binding protein [Mesorhizobium waimense]|uniref:Spermidine/putrescine import ATP-binding protein PotA n=1 Tax=Mesorhizobium waimense TaxID=1300307 RepID=A0A3A5KJA8_9HYPH|nr:ABC transporter ATP-binding protein [Mesorhizobium waimense]RJT32686.1 ABC transporter ATP-binding protein [Mesorhizobium waimense]
MADLEQSMIELQEVSKQFGATFALRPTTLAVKKGEFLTLLGPSGSGKSTLLNLISGGYSSSSGRILLNGSDITDAPPRKRGIGMVFQNYALMPHMTAFDNVAYPLRVRGYSKDDIKAKVTDALKRVGLSGFENRKPKQLSGGQQQRVGIARCIVYSPSIIMMDEPLGALDKNLREQMQDEIKTLHREIGTTFIYVTHDQEEALNMSDRICLMNNGAIVQLGTPDELYFRPINRFAAQFIGESNLLAGTVEANGKLRIATGYCLAMPASRKVTQGEQCEAMLRPERIRIAGTDQRDASTTTATAAGKVVSVSFIGSMTTLAVQLPDGTILKLKSTSLPSQSRYRIGDPIELRWEPEDLVVLQNEK